ncbi:MAG: rhamnulokinase family protein [Candidatus Latescibacterota bacterium]
MATATRKFLAFDLGAESGRAILGRFDGERLGLQEIHRFPNGPVRLFDSLYWDVLRLFAEMREGLSICARDHGSDLESVGVDTWGVDFGLVGTGHVLLENPHHYRDPRTDGMPEEAFARVPREEIFAHTGAQFMRLNTLYQLLALQRDNPSLLGSARALLMMADLFNYFLTGRRVCEFTNATTTQFYNPVKGRWATELLDRFGLPTTILPELVEPGTPIAALLPQVAEQAGLGRVMVMAPATHDTGSAVASIPTTTRDYVYISSGTWSLMGAELPQPRIDAQVLKHNFTNEGGVGHTFRFLKNIMGLWLVQESRRTWERRGRAFSYDELAALAGRAPAFAAQIDPDDGSFMAPGDMPARIADYCRQTGQPVPEGEGGMVRVVLESLALRYRQVLESAEEILGRRMECIHIVGGGIQNRLLCQFTATATRRPVIAGPLEATAIGNLMMQAVGRGDVGSVEEARQVVRRSFQPRTYEPDDPAGWDEAYGRFRRLTG